jgi:hypothetical protein
MEYETVIYSAGKGKSMNSGSSKDKSLEFSLKALEKQEFEMPAVCH